MNCNHTSPSADRTGSDISISHLIFLQIYILQYSITIYIITIGIYHYNNNNNYNNGNNHNIVLKLLGYGNQHGVISINIMGQYCHRMGQVSLRISAGCFPSPTTSTAWAKWAKWAKLRRLRRRPRSKRSRPKGGFGSGEVSPNVITHFSMLINKEIDT